MAVSNLEVNFVAALLVAAELDLEHGRTTKFTPFSRFNFCDIACSFGFPLEEVWIVTPLSFVGSSNVIAAS